MSRKLPEVTTVAAFNAATGAHVDERVVVLALENLHRQGWLTDTEPALTDDESAFLDAHGGVSDNREALLKARVSAATRSKSLARRSLTVDQAAKKMKISTSRVRHRLGEGTLYSYPSRGRGVAREIPRWQFDGKQPVPHLTEVLNALPDDFTSVEIRDFAFHAMVDHPTRDASVPLLDWLRSGGDVATAVELARSQAHLI